MCAFFPVSKIAEKSHIDNGNAICFSLDQKSNFGKVESHQMYWGIRQFVNNTTGHLQTLVNNLTATDVAIIHQTETVSHQFILVYSPVSD